MPPTSSSARQRKKTSRPEEDVDLDEIVPNRTWGRCVLFGAGFLVVQLVLLAGFAHVAQKRTKASGADIKTPHIKTPPPKEEEPSAVSVLSLLTVQPFVEAFPDGTLLNFHTPGCIHCERLRPEFEEAARVLRAKDGAPLASVSTAAAPEVMEKYGVERFPTLLWFRRGKNVAEVPYTARTAQAIVDWVENAVSPPYVVFENMTELVDSADELRLALTARAAPVLAGYDVLGDEDRPMLAHFEMAAERERGRTVFIYVQEGHEHAGMWAIRASESNDAKYTGVLQEEAVVQWVHEQVHRRAHE